MPVLVMGATGNVGSQVVLSLREHGTAVRAVSRQPRAWPDGVEGFVGDPNEPHGLDGALDDVGGVFLMSGYSATASVLAGLSHAHIVVLSASSARLGDSGNAMAAMHLDTERAVEDSGHEWTVLRPCSLQSNLLRWRDQLERGDEVRAPFADVPTAMIHPADVGEVAALALTTSGHAAHTYRLSGPEPLTPGDQLAALGTALGRRLNLVPMSDEEAREEMGQTFGGAAVQIFREYADLESEVQPTVGQLLGRPATPLSTWLGSNVSRFDSRGT